MARKILEAEKNKKNLKKNAMVEKFRQGKKTDEGIQWEN